MTKAANGRNSQLAVSFSTGVGEIIRQSGEVAPVPRSIADTGKALSKGIHQNINGSST